MSFLKRLFGLGDASETPGTAAAAQEVEHKGFTIRATPYKEKGEFQTCGVVSKEIDGALKEHRYVRADRFTSLDAAADQAIVKGRQLIDEQGERLFD